VRTAWAITPEMFLSGQEVAELEAHVRQRVQTTTGREHLSARLDEFIIQALLWSGLRNSEFCALELRDSVVGTGQPTFVVRPRGRTPGRTVWLPDSLVRLTRQWAAEYRPAFLPPTVRPDDLGQPLVFNEHRNGYDRSGLYRRVVRILTEAGLGNRASVQLLRHTYGYLAYLRTGGNLLFVQRQLGHAHPMITRVYAQFAEESYERMANQVAGCPPGGAGIVVPVDEDDRDRWLL